MILKTVFTLMFIAPGQYPSVCDRAPSGIESKYCFALRPPSSVCPKRTSKFRSLVWNLWCFCSGHPLKICIITQVKYAHAKTVLHTTAKHNFQSPESCSTRILRKTITKHRISGTNLLACSFRNMENSMIEDV